MSGATDHRFEDHDVGETSLHDLFLVEGVSAAESIRSVAADDQEVLALQGKIRNALTAPPEEVLADPRCSAIVDRLGVGTGVDCNPSAAIHRLVIATDADIDGLHARALLVVFLHTHLRNLLDVGLCSVVRAPLFALTDDSGEVHYAWTDGQRRRIDDQIGAAGGITVEVRRFKALGQMEPPELRRWVVDPHTRSESSLTTANAAAAVESFRRTQAMGGAPPLS